MKRTILDVCKHWMSKTPVARIGVNFKNILKQSF